MPTPLTYQRIQTSKGTLIMQIPIYNTGDLADSSFRVMTHKGLGAYELVAPTTSLLMRVMTSDGIKAINTVVEEGTGAATVLVVKDTFTKANSTTSLGTAETGQVWQKYGSPVWGISSNLAYPVTLAWDNPAYVETGISDNFDLALKLTVRHTSQQVMWRIVNGTNFYCLQEGDVYRVVDNWFGPVLGTIPNLANGDVVTIRVRGNVHTVLVNGTQVLEITDSYHLTGTKVGFSTNSTTTRIDDFTVHKL